MPIEGHNLSATLKTGFIPLNISDARTFGSTAGESWGNATSAIGTPGAGILSSATAPRLTALSTALRAMVIDWSSGTGVQVQFPPVILPPDFTSVSAPVINILANRAAAASSDQGPVFNFSFYTGLGSSVAPVAIAFTAASSAVVNLTSSVSTTQIAVGYPNTLTVAVQAVSTQDNLKLHGAWITYTRAQRG